MTSFNTNNTAGSSITTWNRLEPRPRKRNFDRTLRAEVRDPLWFLTRQWQLGEFEAEDTGSPILAKIEMETSTMDKISLKGEPASDFLEALPLEARVEREVPDLDLATRMEMGEHFLRILKRRLDQAGTLATEITTILNNFRNHASLQFDLPALNASAPDFATDARLFADREQWQIRMGVSHGKTIDGGALYAYLKGDVTHVASFYHGSPNATIDTAGIDFVAWFERVYVQPQTAAESAWHSSHLEYQFAAGIPNRSTGGRDVVVAEEYYQGHLDWYNFDFETRASKYDASLVTGSADRESSQMDRITVIPTEVLFAGMPNARWWEMEDRNIDLGDLNAGQTDAAKLLLSEFALIYSNDWFVVPHNVKAGSLCEVKQVIVQDVFGQRTRIKHAGEGHPGDWDRWNLYTLGTRGEAVSTSDSRLFVPPVVNRRLEGKPVESVVMLKDEMANMVWGIESVVSSGMGEPLKGEEWVQTYTSFLRKHLPPASPPISLQNGAHLKWSLSDLSVPENWIPFIPVRRGGLLTRSIQLQRAALPRQIEGLPMERIRPRTALLSPGLDQTPVQPFYVYEEEVPRSGIQVHRSWQRCRATDGKVITWLGRSKTNGRGGINTGIRFDQLSQK